MEMSQHTEPEDGLPPQAPLATALRNTNSYGRWQEAFWKEALDTTWGQVYLPVAEFTEPEGKGGTDGKERTREKYCWVVLR